MPYIADENGNAVWVEPDDPRLATSTIQGQQQAFTGDTSTATATSGTWSAQDVLALFQQYGVDPSIHADGSTEDPNVRAQRIANELNSGVRTIEQVQQAISLLPSTEGTGSGPAGTVTAQDVQAIFDRYGVPYGAHADGSYESPQQRIQRIVDEINSGTRSLSDIDTAVRGILDARGTFQEVTEEDITAIFMELGLDPSIHTDGSTEDPATRIARIVQEINSGQRTLAGVRAALEQSAATLGVTAQQFNSVIAPGAALYGVRTQDGRIEYHAVYEWEGMSLSYLIGDEFELKQLFPKLGEVFEAQFTINQHQWNELGALQLGTIDERLGDRTPIEVELTNALRAFGAENLPDWLRNDKQAMQLVAQGALEGFSAGRILRDLTNTTGFQERFGAWDWALAQSGGDEIAAMSLYTQRESQLKRALSTYRGPNADLSNDYLAGLMQNGWTIEAMTPILSAEQQLRADPEILADMNRLLQAEGLNTIGPVGAIAAIATGNQTAEQAAATLAEVDLTSLLGGNDPAQVFDLINDAMTLNALEEQGFTGLDLDFVRQLRTETGRMMSEQEVGQFAQTAATNVLRFGSDIDLDRYGLTEESVVAAVAGRQDPEGRTSSEVNEILSRIVRERQAAASGFDQFTGFSDNQGRLRLQGLQGL